MWSSKYSATKGSMAPVPSSGVFRISVAWRALARIVLGSAWFISAWIIAGPIKHGVWNCWWFDLALGIDPHIQRRKESYSVYRIDAAAQTARGHDHHFGCRRGSA